MGDYCKLPELQNVKEEILTNLFFGFVEMFFNHPFMDQASSVKKCKSYFIYQNL